MKIQILLTSMLLIAISHTAQAAPTLSMGTSTTVADSNSILQLSIADTDMAYGGFNARLEYPSCMAVTNVAAGSLLGDSFVIDSVAATDGATTNLALIAYSGTETFSTDGDLLSLTFQVGADCATGQHIVSFATVNAEPLVNTKHAISNQDGTVSVSHLVTNGGITIMETDNDTDNDGMNDDWEILHFGDLSHNGFADGDRDGYTDLQEYINFLANELDPAETAFDPTVANEAGGTGYQEPSQGGSLWILMIPAIQSAVNAGQ